MITLFQKPFKYPNLSTTSLQQHIVQSTIFIRIIFPWCTENEPVRKGSSSVLFVQDPPHYHDLLRSLVRSSTAVRRYHQPFSPHEPSPLPQLPNVAPHYSPNPFCPSPPLPHPHATHSLPAPSLPLHEAEREAAQKARKGKPGERSGRLRLPASAHAIGIEIDFVVAVEAPVDDFVLDEVGAGLAGTAAGAGIGAELDCERLYITSISCCFWVVTRRLCEGHLPLSSSCRRHGSTKR